MTKLRTESDIDEKTRSILKRMLQDSFSLVLLTPTPVSLMLHCWAMLCSQLVGAECAGRVNRWTANIYSSATAYVGALFAHWSCCSAMHEDQFDSFLLAININGLLDIFDGLWFLMIKICLCASLVSRTASYHLIHSF